jgi:hypothetical protein
LTLRPGGPAGRRAGLAGGPDVWEIVLALRQDGGADASERLAEEMSITADRIAAALRSAAEYPEEIEARIELHQRETAHYASLAGD